MKSDSNKCVNVQKIHREEIHKYVIGDITFLVRAINKNENFDLVLERLKTVVINHTDTKI